MAERQLVVVKEAQQMKSLEELSLYCQNPLDSTVLVILMHGASADKRKALYKSVLKTGVVVESLALRDYEVPQWIQAYYEGRGLQHPSGGRPAAAESAGTDLGKDSRRDGKAPEEPPRRGEGGIRGRCREERGREPPVQHFRTHQVPELPGNGQGPEDCRPSGEAPRFALPMAVAPLFTHFYRILKYHALLPDRRPSQGDAAQVLGVNPYFLKEYDAAVRNYPLQRCMRP